MTGQQPEKPDLTLDLRGLKCPLPALRARKALIPLGSGALVEIETTDPLAGLDIPHMCNEDGHTLVSSERTETGHRFRVRRG
ncbi:sulfurtransferase TusA family protein [Rhizobium sp. C4]|uniref:sulfurtransferase TusA family protein n=1 Tax=Rhizobium sp. C4 TaxID=1349800 RepID=UPI001E541B04|nr:sulfurtransferase TusA family protein [Rhizobium sp. C4]MCD2175679.1 sulfurtransferase TusA family protein [Rhizobium sp. C4]